MHDMYNINFYFFSFFNILKIMTNVYLFKYFNFISAYDGLFSNFCCYKCLYSNTSKHLKTIHKLF